MQEVLKAAEAAEYENALQLYINHNDLTVGRYFESSHAHWERPFVLSYVDVINTVIEVNESRTGASVESLQDKKMYNRLFILTN